ncbi:hypothetical protein DAEQUDRAFT_274785 [Daedalea quercina L-15889]|uniref:Uncharacterized protein n=1 Tax=Daedalea quercina L-15889 TaxID=1314783 RepID=A0A165QEA2_9APHY|nr:hypothetical protein DAEQUDRAFT_274785 [Daedalea quercina L-15889]
MCVTPDSDELLDAPARACCHSLHIYAQALTNGGIIGSDLYMCTVEKGLHLRSPFSMSVDANPEESPPPYSEVDVIIVLVRLNSMRSEQRTLPVFRATSAPIQIRCLGISDFQVATENPPEDLNPLQYRSLRQRPASDYRPDQLKGTYKLNAKCTSWGVQCGEQFLDLSVQSIAKQERYKIGSRVNTQSLVDADHVKTHLGLLGAFMDLRQKVESYPDENIPECARPLKQSHRWAWFVGLAVERFHRWLKYVRQAELAT